MEIVFILAIVIFVVYGHRESKSIKIRKEGLRITQRFVKHLLSADVRDIEDPFDRYVLVIERTVVSCFGQVMYPHLLTDFFPKSVLYRTLSDFSCLSNFGVIYTLIFETLDPPDRLSSTVAEIVRSELDIFPNL